MWQCLSIEMYFMWNDTGWQQSLILFLDWNKLSEVSRTSRRLQFIWSFISFSLFSAPKCSLYSKSKKHSSSSIYAFNYNYSYFVIFDHKHELRISPKILTMVTHPDFSYFVIPIILIIFSKSASVKSSRKKILNTFYWGSI